MSSSEVPELSEHVLDAPTRRAVLTVGGALSLGVVLAACGVRGPPAGPAAPTANAGIASTAPCVRVTTTGARFNPTVELAAGSSATVSWAVEGGPTVTGTSPTISFATAATRHVRMTVEDAGEDALDEVVTFNLGFSHVDDSGTYNMGARHDKAAQAVRFVENVSRLTGLRRFAAANTALAGSLDFTGCSRLLYIECFKSDVRSVKLTGCTSLIRLVVERANLTTLDLNPVAATLRDLRGAVQQGGRLTFTPLVAPLAALYHFCVVEQAVVNHPTAAQLPEVQERWDWETGQPGVLTSASSAIRSLRVSANHYATADLTGQFPAGRGGILKADHNNLTAIALTGCSGLSDIDLSHNRLGTAAVDAVLAVVASWGTGRGSLNLSDNSVPSSNGEASRAILAGRGWEVSTDT